MVGEGGSAQSGQVALHHPGNTGVHVKGSGQFKKMTFFSSYLNEVCMLVGMKVGVLCCKREVTGFHWQIQARFYSGPRLGVCSTVRALLA